MYEREENPRSVTRADLVVGLPSYMEADSIDYPTRQVDKGLSKYFSYKDCVIVNVDNASTDRTEQVFLETETDNPKIYITTPPDTPGKGYNFENLFRKMLELDAALAERRALSAHDSDDRHPSAHGQTLELSGDVIEPEQACRIRTDLLDVIDDEHGRTIADRNHEPLER